MEKKIKKSAEISKQEYVYNEIRQKIIDNIYKPGMMLVERNLCEEIDVSRTPIREAFRRLEKDCLLQIIPGKGAFVSDISTDSMIEIFEMREALEKMTIKLFLLKATNEMFDQVEKCAEEQQAAFQKGDADLFMKKDMEFHSLIAEGSRNRRLMNGVQGIYDQVSMLAISVESDPYLLDMAGKHHAAIFKAIKNRDVEEAEAAMINHIVEIKKYHISRQLGSEDLFL